MSRTRSLRNVFQYLFAIGLLASAPWAQAVSTLNITKTVTSASTDLEGGQTVTFDIDVTNSGDTAAFDVVVDDNPHGNFTSCTLDSVSGGSGAGDLFAAGYTFASFTGATPNGLDAGDSATLQISCDLVATVQDSDFADNHANVQWSDSLGGSTKGPATTSDSVTTAAPAPFIAITATSEAHTSDASADTLGDPRPLVLGENVRYRMWFHVPSGDMFNTVVTAQLPTGLEYIAGSDVLVGLVSTSGTNLTASGVSCSSGTAPRAGNELTDLSTLGLDCVVTPSSGGAGSGDDVLFNLGSVANFETDPADKEIIVIEMNATIVADVASGTDLPVQARIVTDNSDESSTAVVSEYVQPIVDITVTVAPDETGPGQDVEYIVTLAHNGASNIDAKDVSINDVLPAGLTYDSGGGITGPQIPASPGTDTCSIAGLVVDDADPTGAGLTVSFDNLALGDVCEVRYIATTSPGASPGDTYISDVDLIYSTLPGSGTTPNPTGSAPGTDSTTLRSDQTTVTIDVPDPVKSIVSTDHTGTPEGTADTAPDPRPVAIGEIVRYRLLTQLPEGTSTSVSVTDQLPNGLAYVAGSARIALASDSLAITPAPAISCASGTLAVAADDTNIDFITPDCAVEPTGGPFTSGTDPVWSLGTLNNTDGDSDDEYVLVEYDAIVLNESANQDGVQFAGPYDFDANSSTYTSNTVVAEVAEAQLTATITATPNPADNRTDTTPTTAWDVTLSNTGTTAAYQIESVGSSSVRLVLPAGLGQITGVNLTPTGNVFANGTTTPITNGNVSISTTSNANDTLTFDQPIQMDSGASLLIEFDAELLASVAPGNAVTADLALAHSSLPTGDSSSGVRDDVDLSSGSGNTPIGSTATLNDYRTESSLLLNTTAEAPSISVTHVVTTAPASQGDGSYTLTLTSTLTNDGDVPLDNVELTNDLDSTFGTGNYTVTDVRATSTSTTLTEEPAFNGTPGNTDLLSAAGSSLGVGETGTIEIDLTVSPGANLGPYSNPTATNATSARSGNPVSDSTSTDVNFAEQPQIGTALSVVGTPTNNGNGTFTIVYRVVVENSGDSPLTSLQVTGDLATAFADATSFTVDAVSSTDFNVNSGFNGDSDQNLLDGTDTLPNSASGTIDITVTVTPDADLGPYTTTVEGSGTSPASTVVTDISASGTVADANGNGNPGDDSTPTVVNFGEAPQIDLAVTLADGPNSNVDGSFTLTYRLTVENTGDVALSNLQISDDLTAAFPGLPTTVDAITSPGLTVDGSFDGTTNQNLLAGTDVLPVGGQGIVDITITLTPGTQTGPFTNSATANGVSPGSAVVNANASAPATVLSGDAQLGLAKAAEAAVPNFDGTFTTTVTLRLTNTGIEPVSNVQVVDDVAAAIAPATLTRVENLALTGDLSAINAGFDGAGNNNMLSGTESLNPGQQAIISFDLVFAPNGNAGPFQNSAIAQGESSNNPAPGTPNIIDTSTNGADPDPDADGNPGNNSAPTPVTFTPGTDATITITDEPTPGEIITVTVTDPDENTDPNTPDTSTATVTNDDTGEEETIELTETGDDTGVFTADLPTDFNQDPGTDEDGTLSAEPDDVVTATFEDDFTSDGGTGTVTATTTVVGVAGIAGNAWLDSNVDNLFDGLEEPLEGWIIRVTRLGQTIAEATVAADGSYFISGLPPGNDYSVLLVHPQSGATFGLIEGLVLQADIITVDQNLPIDPSGIVYDSESRLPIAGVAANFVADDTGQLLPPACLLAGQQGQTTGDDGFYRFDLIPGADTACPSGGTYRVVLSPPQGYNPGYSTVLPPITDALIPTTLGDPARVGDTQDAPTGNESTGYYVRFTLTTGDPMVVWNHIPLDPVSTANVAVRLVKQADKRTAQIGDLVRYTISLENTTTLNMPGVAISDRLPRGFRYVAGSASTDDGQTITASGAGTLTFTGIDLDAGERRTVQYLLRIGTSAAHGEQINTATPFIGPAPIGNTDTASVTVISDPDFEQTTIIGKVYNDRDGDGWQDSAAANNVVITPIINSSASPIEAILTQGGDGPSTGITHALSEGIGINRLPGRYGINDRSKKNHASLRLRYAQPVNVLSVRITSNEGTELIIGSDGSERHLSGEVKRGLNSQDLRATLSQATYKSGHEIIIELENLGLDEAGVPGVRLATVEGLLIETDAYGRYHIAGVDGGFQERGRNFIVKLDPRTLPEGSRVTTENPRVKRLSQGLMNQFDFGVMIPEVPLGEQRISVKIAEMFFRPGSADVLPGYMDGLRMLARELAKGSLIDLRIETFSDPSEPDSALAHRRAQALIEVLCELVGRDVSAQIDIQHDKELRSDQKIELGRLVDDILGFLISNAHAAEGGCLKDLCSDGNGAPVMLIERPTPSVYEPSKELADQGRVDLLGTRVVRLEDGGVIWLTEDPLELEPRLAVVGPTHLPAEGGQVSGNATFAVQTNYSAFIDALEIAVYERRDADHRNPIAVLRIDTRNDKRTLYTIDWQANGLSARTGDELEYVVSAYDRENRADRTQSHRISIIDAATYEKQVLFATAGKQPTLSILEENGEIFVFVPGTGGERLFQHVAHFEELGTTLSAEDRAALGKIAEALKYAPRVNLKVAGHTSSKPIAQHNLHLFADNYELSKARSQTIIDFFLESLGSDAILVEESHHGPDQPIADNGTTEGLAANRRAQAWVSDDGDNGNGTVHRVARNGAGNATNAGRSLTPTTEQRLKDANDLVRRAIPVSGSRVRVQGNNVGADHIVRIQGEKIPVDLQQRFAVEYLLPIGHHELHVDVIEPGGQRVAQRIPFEVKGSYRFMVALADFTASQGDISGSIEPVSANDRYDDDMLVEGRLALYLKGKVQGKYLITAQLDTREEEIDDLFDNIHRKDAQSLFRRLDPDRYYPVYGDDSTVVADVNSHGRMYARVDWDASSVLWGNFDTGLTGNELIQYNRGLYGLQAKYQSLETTRFDDHRTSASVFGSENQTALGHSEFLGTGGSLYYLRHTDILPGSEKVHLEVRDPATNRVISNQTLQRTADYEVDELQGRIILSRPLMQIAQQSAPSLINDGALGGNITVMLVDYEYVPAGFDANHATYGARAKHWVGDHVGVGVTYVQEGRAAEDYTLGGADITLKAGKDSWVKMEYGTTQATQSERFFSNDGGLSFANLSGAAGSDREGDAYNLDIHVNAADFGGRLNWITNAWYKNVDDQFSIARRDDGVNMEEFGAETHLPIGENWQLGFRGSRLEAEGQLELTEGAVQISRKVGDAGNATGEVKYVEEQRGANSASDALMAAAQYEHKVTERITAYGGGQMSIDQGEGYDNNDQAHLGIDVQLSQSTSGQIEGRDGHRGSAILASLEHALNANHTIYGTVTHSTDSTTDAYNQRAGYTSMLDNVGTNVAAGHRWTLNDRVNLFTEAQHSQGRRNSGVGHVFGLEYADPNGFYGGLTVQQSEVPDSADLTRRKAYSASAGYRMSALRYAAKLEYREDEGAQPIVQWLTTNRLDYKINDTYRVAAKFNYAISENEASNLDVGKLMEGSLGIARRPVDDNRFNWLAKYVYLYDLQSAGQEDPDYDRKLQVLSWEGVYKLTRHFDLGGKLARREGEVRLTQDAGPWYSSTANFAALRLRWHVLKKWDALLEGRWLELEENEETKTGALIAVERHIADNFKLGVGYNFTDFSDDLTDLDFDHKGWFVNAVGKY